jgi:hypothetical protein
VCWLDGEGDEQTAEGESLAELSADMKAQGYAGSAVRVHDVAGFTAGWVSADDWRAA